jgi:hypothetical protein
MGWVTEENLGWFIVGGVLQGIVLVCTHMYGDYRGWTRAHLQQEEINKHLRVANDIDRGQAYDQGYEHGQRDKEAELANREDGSI